ncbi:MAG: mannose-1-phosphate guanylyltransferase [Omnitrophica WOR_2 bacterium]
MYDHYYAVIMAGGGGTRLWPLSRQSRPKQMLSLFDERTLFQTSVERLNPVFNCGRTYVVTVEQQALELEAQGPDIPHENFIIEPMPRGTASVVGLAAIALKHKDPEAVMAVLTSDHYIGNEENFRHTLEVARKVAEEGYLVTLGISPTFPSTGYGYIQRGELLKSYDGLDVFKVERFKEKPSDTQAKMMLLGGDHAWNSGMFVWKVDRILEEMGRLMPEMYGHLMEISQVWDTPERQAVIQEVWPKLKVETIDYGIMEKAKQVAVIPASDLRWSDVGSWDSLFEVLTTDDNGNIVMGGHHIGLDTRNSLVYLNEEHRLIVTIGVSDLVLVDTGDVLLVCPKDQAQRVRQVVSYLKETNRNYI